jgi:hypothetical protein
MQVIVPDKSMQVNQYTMSGELFSKGFPAGGGPCTCSSVCCEGGVYVDLRERDVIMAHRELIAAEMDETQVADPSAWFDAKEEADTDFPSGRCVGTQVIHNKCAFLDRMGRCSIQRAAVHKGLHKWALKPLFCVLYPIEITSHVVSFDDMLQAEQSCCTVETTFDVPIFEGCKEELVHLVGEEGFELMRAHFAALQQPESTS